MVCQHVFQLIYEGQEHLVESKAAAADSLEEEKENMLATKQGKKVVERENGLYMIFGSNPF